MIPLLVFAHRGEARRFLGPGIRGYPDWGGRLYGGKEYFLLISGEGSLDGALHTTAVLAKYGEGISLVINLGVAGALGEDIPLEQVVSPRSLYAHDGKEMQFTSFQNDRTSSLDLITTAARILDDSSREYLHQFGDIVDREAWGIAYACHKMHKDCRIFKLPVDRAQGGRDICQRTKKDSTRYSSVLFDFFSSLNTERPQTLATKSLLPEGFYFSLAQERRFRRLSLTTSPDTVIGEVRRAHGEKTPKERTKILLQKLEDKANPLLTRLRGRLRELSKDFQNDQFRIAYDNTSPHLWIRAHIRNEGDMESLKRRLGDLPYPAIRALLEGDRNVS